MPKLERWKTHGGGFELTQNIVMHATQSILMNQKYKSEDDESKKQIIQRFDGIKSEVCCKNRFTSHASLCGLHHSHLVKRNSLLKSKEHKLELARKFMAKDMGRKVSIRLHTAYTASKWIGDAVWFGGVRHPGHGVAVGTAPRRRPAMSLGFVVGGFLPLLPKLPPQACVVFGEVATRKETQRTHSLLATPFSLSPSRGRSFLFGKRGEGFTTPPVLLSGSLPCALPN